MFTCGFVGIAVFCVLVVPDVCFLLAGGLATCAFCGFGVGESCAWFAVLLPVDLGVGLLICCLCLLLVKMFV